MSYVFLIPKKFDSWSKNVLSGQFISGEISAEKKFLGNFYSTKRFVFKIQGELWPFSRILAVYCQLVP